VAAVAALLATPSAALGELAKSAMFLLCHCRDGEVMTQDVAMKKTQIALSRLPMWSQFSTAMRKYFLF
jgi:hypothetical protein